MLFDCCSQERYDFEALADIMSSERRMQFNAKLIKQFSNLVECPTTMKKRVGILETMEAIFKEPIFGRGAWTALTYRVWRWGEADTRNEILASHMGDHFKWSSWSEVRILQWGLGKGPRSRYSVSIYHLYCLPQRILSCIHSTLVSWNLGKQWFRHSLYCSQAMSPSLS